MKTSRLLGFVIVLQVLALFGQWTGQPALRGAHADITLPNPSERQVAILDEIKVTNSKLDRLIELLQSGDAQVRIAKEDAKK